MAAGEKPCFKLYIASKADKKKTHAIAAGWPSDRGPGLSMRFDKDVVAIKFADGTVAKPDDVWLNSFDERIGSPHSRAVVQPPAGQPDAAIGDDDILF